MTAGPGNLSCVRCWCFSPRVTCIKQLAKNALNLQSTIQSWLLVFFMMRSGVTAGDYAARIPSCIHATSCMTHIVHAWKLSELNFYAAPCGILHFAWNRTSHILWSGTLYCICCFDSTALQHAHVPAVFGCTGCMHNACSFVTVGQ